MADRMIKVDDNDIENLTTLDYLLENLLVINDEEKANVCKAQIKAEFRELIDRNELLLKRIEDVKYSFDMLLDAIDSECDEYQTIRILKAFTVGGFR